MRRRKQYTRESLGRSLNHHVRRGAVRKVTPPGTDGQVWWIDMPPFGVLHLRDKDVYHLVLGLVAGEALLERLDAAIAADANAEVDAALAAAAAALIDPPDEALSDHYADLEADAARGEL